MNDPTPATHGASERTSTSPDAPSRAHRPALAVALDHGALDDVPIAIACSDGTDIVTANAEWRALLEPNCESPTPNRTGVSIMTIAIIGLGSDGVAHLTHRATHDEMTGLANRASFLATLTMLLETTNDPAAIRKERKRER